MHKVRKGEQVFCMNNWSYDDTIRFKKGYWYVVDYTDEKGVRVYSSVDVGMIHWDISWRVLYKDFNYHFCDIETLRKMKLEKINEKG